MKEYFRFQLHYPKFVALHLQRRIITIVISRDPMRPSFSLRTFILWKRLAAQKTTQQFLEVVQKLLELQILNQDLSFKNNENLSFNLYAYSLFPILIAFVFSNTFLVLFEICINFSYEMVVCLMRISSKSRKIIGISNAILIGIMIFLESAQILLKSDKYLEFKNIGILEWLSDQDSLFLYSNLVISTLLIVSIVLLVIVFDVVISQESDHFHVGPRSYSLPIYLSFISFILCILSYSLSLRVSSEFDSKMTKLFMTNYLNYGESRKSRRLIDRIHVDYSCCGVKSIDDFVDLSEIDKSLPTQTKLWSCNEWEYCGVPLSCCKTVSCSQKVELLKEGWDPENITKQWFNRNGCIEKMENAYLFLSYPNYILTDFAMILVLGFHICSMILSQILITSSATLHTAHLETSEASYAWLIDVGQPDPLSLVKKLNPDIDLSEPKSSDHNEEYQGEENDNVEEIISLAACTTEKETKTEIETKNTESSTGTSRKGTSSTGATHASAVSASVMESPGQFSSNEVIIYDSDTGVAKRMPQKTKKTKGDSNLKKNKPKIARKNTETKRKQSKKPSGTNKGRNTKTKKAPNKNLKKKTTANQKKKK
ncbi:CRE-TSP-18 protein [Caenorhabditis remanei]|uniref:CRE-TSP-18 protein n=1 Tax=Caenorhabditis remanei TaxID=31234 RepID=E3LRF6_CAERE|nr:CRE-TSP-18 protein [Caenorhabditis remanei]